MEKTNLLSSFNSSGGEISGEEGSVSFSIGQVNYLSYEGEESNTTEGVQQPLKISIVVPNYYKENEELLTLAAYPNPVSNYFIIEASTYTNLSLKYYLTDLNGRFIKEGRIEESGAKVDISMLPLAIYLLNITESNKTIKTFRIIKK